MTKGMWKVYPNRSVCPRCKSKVSGNFSSPNQAAPSGEKPDGTAGCLVFLALLGAVAFAVYYFFFR